VQFEITPATRAAVQKWIKRGGLRSEDFLFQAEYMLRHIWALANTPESSRAGSRNFGMIRDYGTHSMRRTKATLIYKRTKNLRAVQLLKRRLVAAVPTRSSTPLRKQRITLWQWPETLSLEIG
jgi:hypothetical protein